MKARFLAGMAFMAIALSACDDTTETIGISLTDNMDNLKISTETFEVSTRSIVADSVLSRSSIGYLGSIKDPETGAYITGNFMAQFHTLDNFDLPEADRIMSRENGEIVADSCELRLFYTSFYGDSLAAMKVTAYEMEKPMEEGVNYYSNFDPEARGYLRADGIKQSKSYTLTDLTLSEETRNDDDYMASIRIPLNDPYTDKDGKTYSNYGSYIMQKYYENPENFRNSYKFIHEVCPGFYFKIKGGLGSMAYIRISQLNVYFRYQYADSTYSRGVSFAGTEEVLQTTNVINDKDHIDALVNDNSCTYIKSPAGIFTEMTLPVDEIVRNHMNDTLNTAKVVLTRINNESHTGYELDLPDYLLMVQKDSLYSFFENAKLHNNRTSFLIQRDRTTTSQGSTTTVTYYNTYTFNNISNLIRAMAEAKEQGGDNYTTLHPDWNKVVIVPVTVTTTTDSSNNTIYSSISNNMSLTSTKLVGGSDNQHEKLKISVIYSKFSQE